MVFYLKASEVPRALNYTTTASRLANFSTLPKFDPAVDFCTGGLRTSADDPEARGQELLPACCPRACMACEEGAAACAKHTRSRNATYRDHLTCCPSEIRAGGLLCGGQHNTAHCVLPPDVTEPPFYV